MGNVDWSGFGIPAQTQRKILASLCEVLKCGYGEVAIPIKDGKIIDVIETKRRRMDLREGGYAEDRGN